MVEGVVYPDGARQFSWLGGKEPDDDAQRMARGRAGCNLECRQRVVIPDCLPGTFRSDDD